MHIVYIFIWLSKRKMVFVIYCNFCGISIQSACRPLHIFQYIFPVSAKTAIKAMYIFLYGFQKGKWS